MTASPEEAPERSPAPAFLVVGEVIAPSGLQGALKVKQVTEFPERFAAGSRLYLKGRPYVVEWGRVWKEPYLIVKLAGIDARDEADRLRRAAIEVPVGEAKPLPPGRYYYYQILGLEVVTTAGDRLGKIVDILTTGANDVYVVREDQRETLVPAIADVVKQVDLDRGRVVVEPLVYHGE